MAIATVSLVARLRLPLLVPTKRLTPWRRHENEHEATDAEPGLQLVVTTEIIVRTIVAA